MIYQGRFTPVLHIVMATKKAALYKKVFNLIRTLFPELRPAFIMCDYEIALQRGLKNAYPEADLRGCRFHMARALHFRLKSKLGLAAYYKPGAASERLQNLARTLKCFMLLPCLSEQDIKLEVLRLRDELKTARVTAEIKAKLQKFYRYAPTLLSLFAVTEKY